MSSEVWYKNYSIELYVDLLHNHLIKLILSEGFHGLCSVNRGKFNCPMNSLPHSRNLQFCVLCFQFIHSKRICSCMNFVQCTHARTRTHTHSNGDIVIICVSVILNTVYAGPQAKSSRHNHHNCILPYLCSLPTTVKKSDIWCNLTTAHSHSFWHIIFE